MKHFFWSGPPARESFPPLTLRGRNSLSGGPASISTAALHGSPSLVAWDCAGWLSTLRVRNMAKRTGCITKGHIFWRLLSFNFDCFSGCQVRSKGVFPVTIRLSGTLTMLNQWGQYSYGHLFKLSGFQHDIGRLNGRLTRVLGARSERRFRTHEVWKRR